MLILQPRAGVKDGVICLFLALQQREGWRKAWDGTEEYNTGMFCLAAKGACAEKVVLAVLPSQGTDQFRSCSPRLLWFCCPACLPATALWSLFLYLVTLTVPCSPHPVLLLSLHVDAGGRHLSSTCACGHAPFVVLSVSLGNCHSVFWFPSHYSGNGWVKEEQMCSKYLLKLVNQHPC